MNQLIIIWEVIFVEEATAMVMDIRENYNIFLSIVLYPVVPKGVMMLRLIPTAGRASAGPAR